MNSIPTKTKERLEQKRLTLCTKGKRNNNREVIFYNAEGTMMLVARHTGGSRWWYIGYHNVVIIKDYMEERWILHRGQTSYSFAENVTRIPYRVTSKEEVLALAEQIGTLIM